MFGFIKPSKIDYVFKPIKYITINNDSQLKFKYFKHWYDTKNKKVLFGRLGCDFRDEHLINVLNYIYNILIKQMDNKQLNE